MILSGDVFGSELGVGGSDIFVFQYRGGLGAECGTATPHEESNVGYLPPSYR